MEKSQDSKSELVNKLFSQMACASKEDSEPITDILPPSSLPFVRIGTDNSFLITPTLKFNPPTIQEIAKIKPKTSPNLLTQINGLSRMFFFYSVSNSVRVISREELSGSTNKTLLRSSTSPVVSIELSPCNDFLITTISEDNDVIIYCLSHEEDRIIFNEDTKEIDFNTILSFIPTPSQELAPSMNFPASTSCFKWNPNPNNYYSIIYSIYNEIHLWSIKKILNLTSSKLSYLFPHFSPNLDSIENDDERIIILDDGLTKENIITTMSFNSDGTEILVNVNNFFYIYKNTDFLSHYSLFYKLNTDFLLTSLYCKVNVRDVLVQITKNSPTSLVFTLFHNYNNIYSPSYSLTVGTQNDCTINYNTINTITTLPFIFISFVVSSGNNKSISGLICFHVQYLEENKSSPFVVDYANIFNIKDPIISLSPKWYSHSQEEHDIELLTYLSSGIQLTTLPKDIIYLRSDSLYVKSIPENVVINHSSSSSVVNSITESHFIDSTTHTSNISPVFVSKEAPILTKTEFPPSDDDLCVQCENFSSSDRKDNLSEERTEETKIKILPRPANAPANAPIFHLPHIESTSVNSGTSICSKCWHPGHTEANCDQTKLHSPELNMLPEATHEETKQEPHLEKKKKKEKSTYTPPFVPSSQTALSDEVLTTSKLTKILQERDDKLYKKFDTLFKSLTSRINSLGDDRKKNFIEFKESNDTLMNITRDETPKALSDLLYRYLNDFGRNMSKLVTASNDKLVKDMASMISSNPTHSTVWNDRNTDELASKIVKQLTGQIIPPIQASIQQSISKTLRDHMLPKLEISVKKMLVEIRNAIIDSLKEIDKNIDTSFSNVNEIGITINTAKELVNQLQSTLDGTHPASEKVSIHVDPIVHMKNLLRDNDINGAFDYILSKLNLALLTALCENFSDPRELFSTEPLPLVQTTILSLIQQLAFNMEIDTLFKLKWIKEALLAVDVKDPSLRDSNIQEKVREIMNELFKHLDKCISLNVNNQDIVVKCKEVKQIAKLHIR